MRLIALSIVACTGCSFVAVTGPPSEVPDGEQRPLSKCTTSVFVPVLDTAGAMVGAINIGIAASQSSSGKVTWYSIEMEPETGVALGATQLALFGAGAVYGFIQTARCSAYREEVLRESYAPKRPPEPNRGASPPSDEAP